MDESRSAPLSCLTVAIDSCHGAGKMKPIRAGLCSTLILLTAFVPMLGQAATPSDAEWMRTGMTITIAGLGLAAGSAIAIGFSLDAIDTPLSNTLLLTIPIAAVGAASGALAGRWIADTVLKHQPAPLFALLEGAWLGLFAGAFVGSITFTANFALAFPLLEVPDGYWGRFEYPQALGMAVVSGSVWGGIFGMMVGAAVLPIVSLIMNF